MKYYASINYSLFDLVANDKISQHLVLSQVEYFGQGCLE